MSRSLNPEDTQTLNVVTKDGNVAQLIVKRRDPKTKTQQQTKKETEPTPSLPKKESFHTKPFHTNWIPVSSVFIQPNVIRLDTIALVRNSTATGEDKPKKSTYGNLGNVIDSDR